MIIEIKLEHLLLSQYDVGAEPSEICAVGDGDGNHNMIIGNWYLTTFSSKCTEMWRAYTTLVLN